LGTRRIFCVLEHIQDGALDDPIFQWCNHDWPLPGFAPALWWRRTVCLCELVSLAQSALEAADVLRKV